MINFADLFATFKQNLDKTLSDADMRAEFYWYFSVTTDVDGEVTFEGVANNYYQLLDLLREYVDDELIADIVDKFAAEGIEVAAKYEPTILIDFSETINALEVEYCMLINIVDAD